MQWSGPFRESARPVDVAIGELLSQLCLSRPRFDHHGLLVGQASHSFWRRPFGASPTCAKPWLASGERPGPRASSTPPPGVTQQSVVRDIHGLWGELNGSVSTHAKPNDMNCRLRSFQDGERSSGATKVKQATTAGGDILVVTGARPEVVAKLVIAWTELLGGSEAFEAPHTSSAAFHAAMILFQSVILIRAGTVDHASAER